MTTASWQIGDVRITRIVEMRAVRTPEFGYRNLSTEDILGETWLQPHFATPEGELISCIQAFVVESQGKRIIVDTCVGNDNDLRAIMLGDDGVLAGTGKGGVIIDHTTASAIVAREIAEAAAEKGIGFLDGPVSGGQEGAEKGQLTVMVGGSDENFAKGEPAMQSFAKAVILMGPVGSGQLTKMVNQICCSCSIQALAEGMNFAVKSGLDAHQVVDVISQGAAQSWQMENRGKTMVDGKFDFGFACDWMRKDLDICLDEARANGAQIPLTALIETFYARIQGEGDGRLDNTALYRLLSNA